MQTGNRPYFQVHLLLCSKHSKLFVPVERGCTMLSSPDPRVTKPLISGSEWPSETAKLSVIPQFGQFTARPTSTKLPIVIPASTKRQQTEPLAPPPRRKRRFILPGALLGSLLMV